jgi:tetratricopeptide (TPR) repeat protein
VKWIDRLEIEHDNTRAALSFAIEQEDGPLALRIAGRLWRFWWLRGHLTEGARWVEQVIKLYTGPETTDLVLAYRGAGALAEELADVVSAEDFYERSWLAARAVGDRYGEATALMSVGILAANTGNYDQALARYAEALPIFEEIGDTRGIMSCVGNAAGVSFYRGDLDAAEMGYKRAHDLLLQIDDPRSATVLLGNLGAVYYEQHRFEEALAVLTQVIAECKAMGDEVGEATAQVNLGGCHSNLGNLEDALVATRRALEITERLDMTRAAGFAKASLSRIEMYLGNLEASAAHAASGLADLRSASDPAAMSGIAIALAELAMVSDRPEMAARFYGVSEGLLASLDTDQAPEANEVRQHNYAEIASDIGEEAMGAALEAGRGLSVDEYEALLSEFQTQLSSIPIDPADAALVADTGLALGDLTLLRLFLAGKSNAEIARELVTEPSMIVNRIGYLYTKTGTDSRATLTAWAFKAGIA